MFVEAEAAGYPRSGGAERVASRTALFGGVLVHRDCGSCGDRFVAALDVVYIPAVVS